jgi:chromosome partitioning protein
MSAPIVAVFNNRAGVGTTTLVYHLGWMFWDLGFKVLVADLDPQADLSVAFHGYNRLEGLLLARFPSIYDLISASAESTRSLKFFPPETAGLNPPLLVADPRLSLFDHRAPPSPAGLSSALRRIFSIAAESCGAQAVLVDLGPNLGAVNRAALLVADYLVVPLGADLFSVQGLRNLGSVLRDGEKGPPTMRTARPLGYVVEQPPPFLNRLVGFYGRWLPRIPAEFRNSVLSNSTAESGSSVNDDPWCLAVLKHYHSLMQMAQEAQKPMFHLKPADGAIGSHFQAAQSVGKDFEKLARRIADGVGLEIPQFSGA